MILLFLNYFLFSQDIGEVRESLYELYSAKFGQQEELECNSLNEVRNLLMYEYQSEIFDMKSYL